MVLEAKEQNTSAMAAFCQDYWFPLYGYARRIGYSPTDAEDITQDFFQKMLSTNFFANVQPDRGRMRSFLLKSFRNHATKDYRKRQRQKRGGGAEILDIGTLEAEQRLEGALTEAVTPEVEFDRLWARELIDRARTKIAERYRKEGKSEIYETFKEQLVSGSSEASYRDIADTLNLTEAAARYAAFTLRSRFRAALKQEVIDTVGSDEEAEEEFAFLQQIFESPG